MESFDSLSNSDTLLDVSRLDPYDTDISELTTRIHNLKEENQESKNLIQAMKDEIRRLKSAKGQPVIRPSPPTIYPPKRNNDRARSKTMPPSSPAKRVS